MLSDVALVLGMDRIAKAASDKSCHSGFWRPLQNLIGFSNSVKSPKGEAEFVSDDGKREMESE